MYKQYLAQNFWDFYIFDPQHFFYITNSYSSWTDREHGSALDFMKQMLSEMLGSVLLVRPVFLFLLSIGCVSMDSQGQAVGGKLEEVNINRTNIPGQDMFSQVSFSLAWRQETTKQVMILAVWAPLQMCWLLQGQLYCQAQISSLKPQLKLYFSCQTAIHNPTSSKV